MNYVNLAQDFVNRAKQLFDIDMNIINDKGIIIASSQINRIGDFHNLAYKMIKNKIDYTHNDNLDKSLIGVLTGVNMLLKKNGIPYGVIGITGVSKENEKLINIMKYFFETINEYSQTSIFEYTPKIGDLALSLFIEKPLNVSKILNLFDHIHRDPKAIRLPILITLSDNDKTDKIFYQLKNHYDHNFQSLLFLISSYDIMFWFNTDFKEQPSSIIAEIINFLDQICEEELQYKIYYTMPINDISSYFLCYCQLMWLKDITLYDKAKSISILDHLNMLIISSQSWDNYNNILQYFRNRLLEFDYMQEFLKIASALIRNNMNYSQAAQSMYVHKNTIVYKMDKLKTVLGIDPYNNHSHMSLFSFLYYYILLNNNDTTSSFQKFYDKYTR